MGRIPPQVVWIVVKLKLYRGSAAQEIMITHHFGIELYLDREPDYYRPWRIPDYRDEFEVLNSSVLIEILWGELLHHWLYS